MSEEKVEETEVNEELETQRRPRAKLSPEESRKRMEEFPKRRDAFIAAIRNGNG
jgi:hypothetical protein